MLPVVFACGLALRFTSKRNFSNPIKLRTLSIHDVLILHEREMFTLSRGTIDNEAISMERRVKSCLFIHSLPFYNSGEIPKFSSMGEKVA